MLHRIEKKTVTYRFDPSLEPAVIVESGDYILFHTQDAHSGTIDIKKLWADVLFPELDENTGNPVTGLVYVKGAKPGMTLKIIVLQIIPDAVGVLPVRSYMGDIRNAVNERTARVVKYSNSRLWISENLSVKARPMIGTIGVAPESGAIATAFPGSHGGNLDDNSITVGAEVYLPIAAEGALLGVGDVHAAMGDGELTCGGADISAQVLVKIETLEEPLPCKNPVVIKDDTIVTHGFSDTYEKSAETACKDMIHLLKNKMKIIEYEALLLMAARGDIGLCQACRCHIPMVVRVSFPVIW